MIAEKRISDILFEIEMNSHNTMSQVQEHVPQGHSAGTYMSLLRDGYQEQNTLGSCKTLSY